MGIEQKNAEGKKIDQTIDLAEIANSTNVVMTTVASNAKAIGYISLGSLNDTVKALQIDGVDATADNIIAGTYKVARPFNIATKGEISDVAADFIKFIMSADGQKLVTENKYISKGQRRRVQSRRLERQDCRRRLLLRPRRLWKSWPRPTWGSIPASPSSFRPATPPPA